MDTKREIEVRLQLALEPVILKLQDDSHKHRHHAEAKQSGGSHFTLLIVSKQFSGKQLIERHRLVYHILDDLMKQAVHALAIRAFTPEEWDAAQNLSAN